MWDSTEPSTVAASATVVSATIYCAIDEDRAVMPKLKTHKGMKKRFKVSATGKVSHKRAALPT